MISNRHAETDRALDFCKKHSLLLALDSETPQDQLRVAAHMVIDAFRTWRSATYHSVTGQQHEPPARRQQRRTGTAAFADAAFGEQFSVVKSGGSASSSAASSRGSSSRSNSVDRGEKAVADAAVGHTQAMMMPADLPSVPFRPPFFFFTVGFLRLRRLAHSRFRLRDILRRYMASRRAFIAQSLETWRERECAARIHTDFSEYVLVYVPPALRRQVLCDFLCACAHQALLLLRAVRSPDPRALMDLRQRFFVWAYHQRKTSSSTFRVAIVTMMLLQERARKRAWVRTLLGKEKKPQEQEQDGGGPAAPSLAFGSNSRVASLLLAGCTSPVKWCKSLLSLQSLAWCCALRRHQYQLLLDQRAGCVYRDLSAAVKGLQAAGGDVGDAATATPNSSRTNSLSSLLSSLSSNAEAKVQLDPATLALVFAPWVSVPVTAAWFSLHLQKFATRNLEGAPKCVATVLSEQLRAQLEQQQQQQQRPGALTVAATAALAAPEATKPATTDGLFVKTVLSEAIFEPFAFVDLSHADDGDGDGTAAADAARKQALRRRLEAMEKGVFFAATLARGAHQQQQQQQQQGEYVFRGRRTFDDSSSPSAKPLQQPLTQAALALHSQQHQQQQGGSAVTVAAGGGLVSAKALRAKTVQMKDDAVLVEEHGADAAAEENDASAATSSPLRRRNSSVRGGAAAAAAGGSKPTAGQLFSMMQLRKHREAEFDYAHNFSFLLDGANNNSPSNSLRRTRSAAAAGSMKASGGNSPLRAVNFTGSFRAKVNSLIRSQSLRLPSSKSFRGIHSAYTAVAAQPELLPALASRRCPTLWGSSWLVDPFWHGEADNVHALFFNATAADAENSSYRKVMRLAVLTGALRITDPSLLRRLDRVNAMMVAARQREIRDERIRLKRERAMLDQVHGDKRRRIAQEQAQQEAVARARDERGGATSPSRQRRKASPALFEERQRAAADREEHGSRLMWTAKQRPPPEVRATLFGQHLGADDTAIMTMDQLGAGKHTPSMLTVQQHEAYAAMKSTSNATATTAAAAAENTAAPIPRRDWQSTASSVSSSLSAPHFVAAAPVFLAPCRPATPKTARQLRSAAGTAAVAVDIVLQQQEQETVRQRRMSTPTSLKPTPPLAAGSRGARIPSALARPNSTLLTQKRQQQQQQELSSSRIVVVDDAVVAAEHERCALVAPAPPSLRPVKPIVRGASANRKRVVQTRATCGGPGAVALAASAGSERADAVAAAASSSSAAEDCGSNNSDCDGLFVIERSALHTKSNNRDCWTSDSLPCDAPQPFGFTVGFPAIFAILSRRDNARPSSTAVTAFDAAPPKHFLA